MQRFFTFIAGTLLSFSASTIIAMHSTELEKHINTILQDEQWPHIHAADRLQIYDTDTRTARAQSINNQLNKQTTNTEFNTALQSALPHTAENASRTINLLSNLISLASFNDTDNTIHACTCISSSRRINFLLKFFAAIENKHPQKDTKLSITSLASGNLLQEALLIQGLINLGYTALTLNCIDTDYHADALTHCKIQKLFFAFKDLITSINEYRAAITIIYHDSAYTLPKETPSDIIIMIDPGLLSSFKFPRPFFHSINNPSAKSNTIAFKFSKNSGAPDAYLFIPLILRTQNPIFYQDTALAHHHHPAVNQLLETLRTLYTTSNGTPFCQAVIEHAKTNKFIKNYFLAADPNLTLQELIHSKGKNALAGMLQYKKTKHPECPQMFIKGMESAIIGNTQEYLQKNVIEQYTGIDLISNGYEAHTL